MNEINFTELEQCLTTPADDEAWILDVKDWAKSQGISYMLWEDQEAAYIHAIAES